MENINLKNIRNFFNCMLFVMLGLTLAVLTINYPYNLERTLAIVSGLCLVLATIGFLLVQYIYDRNIKKRQQENIDLISYQRATADCIEKANSYKELAMLTSDHIDIFKILSMPQDQISKKEQRHYLVPNQASIMELFNAITASHIKTDQEIKDLKANVLDKLGGFNKKELTELYVKHMEDAAKSTHVLQNQIDENTKIILQKEKEKNLFWYICFTLQTLGMIAGFSALVLNK